MLNFIIWVFVAKISLHLITKEFLRKILERPETVLTTFCLALSSSSSNLSASSYNKQIKEQHNQNIYFDGIRGSHEKAKP